MMKKQHIVVPLADCVSDMIGATLWMLEDTRNRTLREITNLKADIIDWCGGASNHSIGTLLYHIAAIEISWLAEEVAPGAIPSNVWDDFPIDVRNELGELSPVVGVPLEEHLRRLDYTRQVLLQVYKPMTLADYRRPRHFEAYDVTPEWVLHHLMQHEAGHREEICTLRNLSS